MEVEAALLEDKWRQSPNDETEISFLHMQNQVEEKREWIQYTDTLPLDQNQVLAVADSAGAAFLLIVRETFKSPLMVLLYSLFVIAATFHGFNGVWTFMIVWGITLTRLSQKRMRTLTSFMMYLVMFFGLMASVGTYLSMVL